MKKIFKWLNNIVTFLLFTLLIGVAAMVIVTNSSGGEPELFGYQIKTVLSGSMEPDIQTGSIIAIEPTEDKTNFKTGDIITFQEEEEKLITHRITEVMEKEDTVLYRTKGDNNNAEDRKPVLSDNVIAKYTGFTIPYIGYLAAFAQSKNGALLLLIPGFILLIYSGFTIWGALSTMEYNQKSQVESSYRTNKKQSS